MAEERGTPEEPRTTPREGGGGFVDDLKAAPADVRDAVREADDRLDRELRERPKLVPFLDLRIVLGAALAALVVALILRLIGLSVLVSVVLFLLLFAGIWLALGRALRKPSPPAAERPPEG